MKLDEYLSLTGQTERGFAARVGSSGATISRIRRGLNLPRISLAVRIESITNGLVTTRDLAETVKEPPYESSRSLG
jgi:transcriptional regulator with XRE-family HTH domain